MTKRVNKGAKRPENTPQAAARAAHTHEYGFWHAHGHMHDGMAHSTGHCHSWVQTHGHGKPSSTPHTHQARQAHPDEEYKHHHATINHEKGG